MSRANQKTVEINFFDTVILKMGSEEILNLSVVYSLIIY